MIPGANKASREAMPRPFLKWAGGKTQLLNELRARVVAAQPFGRYHEPFLGGGALFFELVRSGCLGSRPAALSDTNGNLIDTYRALRQDVEEVILRLREHAERHHKEHYYAVRANVPTGLTDRAARIIYLNRTCFNGLYRENSKGGFNVPMGRYKNPRICDAENLRAVARAMQHAEVETHPFQEVLKVAQPNDLVYFDPPYDPVSQTASFTNYAKAGFDRDAQCLLAEVFRELHHRGVKVLLSNSSTEFVRDLYERFTVEQVFASRSVNSRSDKRGKVAEVLVRNFDGPKDAAASHRQSRPQQTEPLPGFE